MSPIKVAFDSRIFSQQRYGGVSRYFAELHRGFATEPDIRAMVAAGFHANTYLDRSLGDVYGARLNRFPGPVHRRIGEINDALSARATRLLKPDIMHYTTYVQPPVPGTLTVTTVHDFIHDLFPEYFDSTEYEERQAAAVAASDGIICISESTRRDMEQTYGATNTPVLVSHHGVSGPLLSRSRVPDLVAARRTSQTLLFVGSRFGYKSFDLLLEAMALLDDQRSHLVCVGPPLTDTELTLARRLGVDPKRVSTTSASDDQLTELYRSCTALVYPSRYEGFGLPVVEAMAQGCLVVCGRNSSLPEVGGAAAHYFDDHEAEALANALASVLDLDADVFEASSYACIDQSENFTWRSAVNRHRDFYRAIAG